MANAQHDQNHIPTLITALDSDGSTVVVVKVNPTSHSLKTSSDAGSDNGPVNALKDENHVSSLVAVSSADGVTPVVVYANSDGELLIQST